MMLRKVVLETEMRDLGGPGARLCKEQPRLLRSLSRPLFRRNGSDDQPASPCGWQWNFCLLDGCGDQFLHLRVPEPRSGLQAYETCLLART
jgi:hypothetical protein